MENNQWIQILDLEVKYGRELALDHISFHIRKNEFLGIIGANGSGKTTLLHTLLGLKELSEGKIIYASSNPIISYIPQNISVSRMPFPATVLEIILTGLCGKHWKPFYSNQDRRRAEEVMDRFGISDLKQKRINELSGGQRQRVLLARAMIQTPDILFLDEPSSALDAEGKTELRETLLMLRRQTEMTVVMVTHDLREFMDTFDRVMELDGRISFLGTVSEYRAMLNDREKEGVL